MAFPPPAGGPMGQPPMFRAAPPFPMPHAQPGLLPMGPGPMPHMGAGVRLPLQPPLGVPPLPMGMPAVPAPIQHTISAPPVNLEMPKQVQSKVPVISAADMKVATTIFVGNISDKATDTLVRQILLRCGRIEGWKRVQDASGKLQAFGFCEYGDPESTLRALRLLHDFKLGEKSLVVKVDAKTRKDLLKYVIKKKNTKKNLPVDDESIEKEVADIEDKDNGITVLRKEVDEDMKEEDDRITNVIKSLVRENIEVLSTSKSSKDEQLERDVTDALLSMAKQSGKIDPDSTLDDMDMEADMKTLVSDEIKKFRQSYQRDEEKKQAKRDRVARSKGRERSREREKEKERGKDKDSEKQSSQDSSRREREKGRSPQRDHSRSPRRRSRSPRRERSRSPQRSPRRSPVRFRSQERAEREKQRERERERERNALVREEEEYEERQRAKKQRERERAYRDRLEVWMSRERRKAKEHEKDYEKEGEKRDEMERERKHLAEFLEDYDDEKDDQRYYKGSAYARRRRERELEIEEDERDRHREKEEIEALRLQVMERQHQERRTAEQQSRGEEEESGMEESSSPEDSPQRREEEEEEDVHVKEEIEEDIPLTKPGYPVPAAYPPIQVQSAPVVMAPEIKDHPREKNIGDGISIRTFEPVKREEMIKKEEEMEEGEDTPSSGSPQTAPKLAFGLVKKSLGSGNSVSVPPSKKVKLEHVFSTEEDELELKPKKKLVPIQYSEEEQQAVGRTNKTALATSTSRSQSTTRQPLEERKISPEERKKMIQNLVNSIPTTKEEVFAYELKWEQIDQTLMDKRVGPWINKKIVEYVGEEEPSLKDFICNKLACNITPAALLGDIAVVLDDEAEVFVVKLWRLLIYETEAKHLGIAKNY